MAHTTKKPEILEAALHLFVEKGIRGTTTKDLATVVGISEGTIYRHFASKEDLARTLFISCMEQFRSSLEQAVTDVPADPRVQLGAVLRAFFRFAQEKPRIYAYVIEAHTTELPQIPPTLRKPMDVFVEIIQAGMEQGLFRAMPVRLAAALVIGMAVRVIFFLHQGMINLSPEQATAEVQRAALKALAPD